MILSDDLERLRALSLHGFVDALDHQFSSPGFEELGFLERLRHCIGSEENERQRRRRTRLLKEAKLRVHADPKLIDYRPGRGLDRPQMQDLLACTWVEKRLNLILTGPTGTGKTWLGCALAVQAAWKGYSVRYARTALLLEEMALAHEDGSMRRLRPALAKVDLLLLDDFGLSPLSTRGKQDLLEVLEARAGTGSTLIAGQMPVTSWHAWIDDKALADAILDRVVHTSHRIQLGGKSMRELTSELTQED